MGRNLPFPLIWPFPIDLAKSVGNRLTDFDDIRTSELSPERQSPSKISFRSDNVGCLSMTEKTISGVHVSSGSAETLVMTDGITNHHSLAYSFINISAENYRKLPKSVEVIERNINVVLETVYIGHGRLRVCVSVCVCPSPHSHCRDPDVTWENGRGCPLVVYCWADLQSVHGFPCCDNIYVYKLSRTHYKCV